MQKILALVTLEINAQQAKSGPPIGPKLGVYGIDLKKFCDTFNNLTKIIPYGWSCKALVTIYADRTFILKIKMPSTAFLVKRFINDDDMSITVEDLYKIALIKNLEHEYCLTNLNGFIFCLKGSLKSMDIEIIF